MAMGELIQRLKKYLEIQKFSCYVPFMYKSASQLKFCDPGYKKWVLIQPSQFF